MADTKVRERGPAGTGGQAGAWGGERGWEGGEKEAAGWGRGVTETGGGEA